MTTELTTQQPHRSRLLREISDRVMAQQPAMFADTVEARRMVDELRGILHSDSPDVLTPDAVLTWDGFAGLRVCAVHRDHPLYGQLVPAPVDLGEAVIALNGAEIIWNRPVDTLRGATTIPGAAAPSRVPTRLNDPVTLLAFLEAADPAAAAVYTAGTSAYPHGLLTCNCLPFCEVIVMLNQFGKFLRNGPVMVAFTSTLNRQRFNPVRNGVPTAELRANSPALRDAVAVGRNAYNNVTCTRVPIIVDTDVALPAEIAASIANLTYPLPSGPELAALVNPYLVGAQQAPLDGEALYRVSRVLLGLTERQAANAICLAITQHGDISQPDALTAIEEEKMAALRADQLSYVPVAQLPHPEDIAGYDRYKDWLHELRATYTRAAVEAHVPRPRGMLLLGGPGGGKSIVGLMTARALGVPCVRLDFSALFQGIVGASESAMRRVLKTIDGLGECVVFIDEIDKGLAGAETNSATTDSGVSKRIFGQLLTAMAENKSGAFFIMTANRVAALPPETFRLGRVDAIWYVDTPTPDEAEEICRIHLRKNHRDAAAIMGAHGNPDLRRLRELLSDLVGSEIEHGVVIPAIRRAWVENNRPLTLDDLEQRALEARDTCLKARNGAQLDAIRDTQKQGARNVSSAIPAAAEPIEVSRQGRTPRRRRTGDATATDTGSES